MAVDGEFMYIGSASPGPGGRADGRAAGLILNDSTTIFIDVHKKQQKPLCFSVISHRTGAQVSICIAKMKTWLRKYAKSIMFFEFPNHPNAQVPMFTPKMKKMNTPADPADPPDPPETRHEAWCTTPGTLAPEVRMTVVLNKLPQIIMILIILLQYLIEDCNIIMRILQFSVNHCMILMV